MPAVPDTRSAAERVADEAAPSFAPGPIVKFNGKVGQFELAGSEEAIADGIRYAALVSRNVERPHQV